MIVSLAKRKITLRTFDNDAECAVGSVLGTVRELTGA